MIPTERPKQDNAPPETGPPSLQHGLGDDFAMGVRFFSRLPLGDVQAGSPSLARIAPALPFVSLAIGAGPALVLMGLTWLGAPSLVAAAIAVGVMIGVTGAMSEDALADAADGLAGGSTIERRLEIMKDSRHGTYGVVAIVLHLVIRIAGLGAVAALNPLAAGGLLLAASVIARSGSLWLAAELPAAREGGAAASAGRPSRRAFAIGLGFALILTFILAGPFVGGAGLVLAALVALVIATGWVWICRRLVGGQTGDLIGALQALLETAVLAVFVIFA